jgi:hypothetical protein
MPIGFEAVATRRKVEAPRNLKYHLRALPDTPVEHHGEGEALAVGVEHDSAAQS